jgi:hypothetical protein
MWTFFQDSARGTNGIFDAMKTGDGTGAERGGVHNDGVALDLAVKIQMGAVAGVEDRIVFEHDDRGFYCIEGVTSGGQNFPTGLQSAPAAGLACCNGFIWNIPSTTVNDQRSRHRERELQRAGGFVQMAIEEVICWSVEPLPFSFCKQNPLQGEPQCWS